MAENPSVRSHLVANLAHSNALLRKAQAQQRELLGTYAEGWEAALLALTSAESLIDRQKGELLRIQVMQQTLRAELGDRDRDVADLGQALKTARAERNALASENEMLRRRIAELERAQPKPGDHRHPENGRPGLGEQVMMVEEERPF